MSSMIVMYKRGLINIAFGVFGGRDLGHTRMVIGSPIVMDHAEVSGIYKTGHGVLTKHERPLRRVDYDTMHAHFTSRNCTSLRWYSLQ